MMEQYQCEFVEFAIAQKALLFGEFTLKSGRISPYFFNIGRFNTGGALVKLGKFYAIAINKAGFDFDLLFGPAYKGIPLVAGIAIAFSEISQRDVPFCFNRKEVKAYGEGGHMIGAPLQGRVLLVDDVVSAGTTFKETAELIAHYPAQIVGIITAIDRQERGQTQLSATEEIASQYHVKAVSIVKLKHLIDYLHHQPRLQKELESMLAYQEKYGVVQI
jgi:orotate phosphoribosyltransferase